MSTLDLEELEADRNIASQSHMKEYSCEYKQKQMVTEQANTRAVHPGSNIPIVLFVIILEKNE